MLLHARGRPVGTRQATSPRPCVTRGRVSPSPAVTAPRCLATPLRPRAGSGGTGQRSRRRALCVKWHLLTQQIQRCGRAGGAAGTAGSSLGRGLPHGTAPAAGGARRDPPSPSPSVSAAAAAPVATARPYGRGTGGWASQGQGEARHRGGAQDPPRCIRDESTTRAGGWRGFWGCPCCPPRLVLGGSVPKPPAGTVTRASALSLQRRQLLRGTMPEQSNDYRVVVFGAGGVGKSSLVLRFVKGTFRDTYIPTIEDTYRQVISCDKSVCTLQITDTTGSHQFPAMQRLSISKGHAFILVFSVTSKQSLEELKPIYQQIVQIKGSVESIPIMLVGNKCDETQREVESREGEAVAKEWKCAFMETSAKMNYNVKELFQELLNLEKRRNVSLTIDGKRSSKQKRTDKIKGKCSIM
ncbi:Zinc transporter ZIP3 [Aix galericulata]|nr:Zinc transporter ZIP3 [Aix galericulata]